MGYNYTSTANFGGSLDKVKIRLITSQKLMGAITYPYPHFSQFLLVKGARNVKQSSQSRYVKHFIILLKTHSNKYAVIFLNLNATWYVLILNVNDDLHKWRKYAPVKEIIIRFGVWLSSVRIALEMSVFQEAILSWRQCVNRGYTLFEGEYSFLHARLWIPGDEIAIFTAVIH